MKRHVPTVAIFFVALIGCYAIWSFFSNEENLVPGKGGDMERVKTTCMEFERLSSEWVDLHFSVTDRGSADTAAPAMREVEARMQEKLHEFRRLQNAIGSAFCNAIWQTGDALRFVELNGVILKADNMRFLAARPEPWFGSKVLREVCMESCVDPDERIPLPELMGFRAAGCTATTQAFTKRLLVALSGVTDKEQADAAVPVVQKAANAFRIRNSEADAVQEYQAKATDAEKAEFKQAMLDCLADVPQDGAADASKLLKTQIDRLRQASPAFYGSEPLQQALEEFLTAAGED